MVTLPFHRKGLPPIPSLFPKGGLVTMSPCSPLRGWRGYPHSDVDLRGWVGIMIMIMSMMMSIISIIINIFSINNEILIIKSLFLKGYWL